MTDLIEKWLFTEGFMPHGHCYLWTPEILWTYAAADAAIGLAYYSIPLALLTLVRKRRDLHSVGQGGEDGGQPHGHHHGRPRDPA